MEVLLEPKAPRKEASTSGLYIVEILELRLLHHNISLPVTLSLLFASYPTSYRCIR